MTFSQLLRREMARAGDDFVSLAEKVNGNPSRQSLGYYARAKRHPTVYKFIRVARVYPELLRWVQQEVASEAPRYRGAGKSDRNETQ